MHVFWGLTGAVAMLATGALAEPVQGRAAKKVLYPVDAIAAEMLPASGLPADQLAILQIVAIGQPYYGAIAISPEEGLMSEATVAAANHHTTEAASAAALADCDAKRKGAAPCVLAALIRPEGWEPQAVQLSLQATEGFDKDYPRRNGALAISALTGAWGLAAGDGAADAAVAACVARNPAATDCLVVIAD